MTSALLKIDNLDVNFQQGDKLTSAARNVSLEINRGETVALIGESGSGKSVTALSILQLLPYPIAKHSDKSSIQFNGRELVGAPEKILRTIRGNQISMIFQEPMTSLNPLHTVEKQISEVLVLHEGLNKQQAKNRTIELLELVQIPNPAERLDSYPHQLSGGQRQRVMIAMALANKPDLLIADEPTTAVDVTIQAQLLELLQSLQNKLDMAILLITHDLRVVQKMASQVYVMRQGDIVESGMVTKTFADPQHDYTKMLINSKPSGHPKTVDESASEVIRANNLRVWFPIKRGLFRRTVGHIKAVDDVSFSVRSGETLGLVGESGSGKSSLGMACLRLIDSNGEILVSGQRVDQLTQRTIKPFRKDVQIVFQDPFSSLSPRMTIGQIISEGLTLHGIANNSIELNQIIEIALEEVGLSAEMRHRYPHEFSGGQRQRISIARAIVLKPKFIVLDEPTSALDLSIQAQIIDLLRNLQKKYDISYLFISHDLNVVRAMSHRVMIMKDGKVIENGSVNDIFDSPKQDYTKMLLAASTELTTR
jgi:microcin C transport system ATP-binding protein